MTGVEIIGWGHGVFGRSPEPDVENLIATVLPAALEHAHVDPDEVGAVFVSTLNNGFSPQDFAAALPALSVPGLRNTPAVRLENACSSGSAAVYAACDFLEAGRGDVAVVVGVEQMLKVPPASVGDILLKSCYRPEESEVSGGFAGVFSLIAREYFNRYGDQSEAMARIAAKNHANGSTNPYAQFRKDLGFDHCNAVSDRNPMIAAPLRRTDCAPLTDGAACLVLARPERAGAPQRVRFRARAQVNDYLPLSRRDPTAFDGAKAAWEKALSEAYVSRSDLDLLETHDCFTIAELIQYEAFGLAAPGQGADVVLSGMTSRDGEFPVNPSGGLKAKGHPIGATGVSMHALVAMQLTDSAEGFQVPNTQLAALFNMGGTAVANYVSVLEAV